MGYPNPKEGYHLPPLVDLFSNNMANVSLDRLSGALSVTGYQGVTEYPHFQMWMNLVSLTDLAIRRYEESRTSLAIFEEFAFEGRVSPFYDAVNSLEETVVATHRAILNSQRLREITPRRLNVPTARQLEVLRVMRNHIQHMDEKLAEGKVTQGDFHVLAPLPKSFIIGSKILQYRDLASCITKMYRNVEIIRQAPSK